jgi:nucleoside-diphosphate-sugar epimerase
MDCPVGDGRAINVGGGRNISINRVAELIGGPTVNLPARPGDARHTLADVGEAQRTLGWRPEVKFEDGLAALIRLHGL